MLSICSVARPGNHERKPMTCFSVYSFVLDPIAISVDSRASFNCTAATNILGSCCRSGIPYFR
jgi:hypothetical protein